MSLKNGLFTTIKAVLMDPNRFELGFGEGGHLQTIGIGRCAKLDELAGERDTHEKARMYAHWGCKPKTICLARDFPRLPLANQIGIILHEIGHACCGHQGEPQADLWIKDRFGIEVEYSEELQLQRVKPEVVKMFQEAGDGK